MASSCLRLCLFLWPRGVKSISTFGEKEQKTRKGTLLLFAGKNFDPKIAQSTILCCFFFPPDVIEDKYLSINPIVESITMTTYQCHTSLLDQ